MPHPSGPRPVGPPPPPLWPPLSPAQMMPPAQQPQMQYPAQLHPAQMQQLIEALRPTPVVPVALSRGQQRKAKQEKKRADWKAKSTGQKVAILVGPWVAIAIALIILINVFPQ